MASAPAFRPPPPTGGGHLRIACLDEQPVVVDGDGAGYGLSPLLDHPECLATAGDRMLAVIHGWERIETLIRDGGVGGLPPVATADAIWSAPVPRPGKIVAAPVNYLAHGVEMQMDFTVEHLGVFLKAPSAVIGPSQFVELPFPERRTDHEAELAVVIGRRARRVAPAEALNFVLGYTCLLDITLRGDEERSTRKSFDTFAPMGPWIMTAAGVGDPDSLRLRCWVNGDLRQDASTSDLIYSVPRLISYVSDIMTLEPGDIVSTGTPAGVGPLRPGDRIAVEIERVGRLEVGVRPA